MAMAFSFFRALRRRLARQATSGSAAIEFAFVAPVFFFLLMGIIETGVMFFGQFTLANAVVLTGREIRTGIAQSVNYAGASVCSGGSGGSGTGGTYATSQEWFKDQICCYIHVLLPCANLHVNVQSFSNGFGNNFTPAMDANGYYLPATDSYSPGAGCDVVLVRATYSWQVLTPTLTWFLKNMSDGNHLISSTMAFRNEPFSGANC